VIVAFLAARDKHCSLSVIIKVKMQVTLSLTVAGGGRRLNRMIMFTARRWNSKVDLKLWEPIYRSTESSSHMNHTRRNMYRSTGLRVAIVHFADNLNYVKRGKISTPKNVAVNVS